MSSPVSLPKIPLSTFDRKFLITCNLTLKKTISYIDKFINSSHSLMAGIIL